jgi:YidC/Oxa1 family membrane protein insertase
LREPYGIASSKAKQEEGTMSLISNFFNMIITYPIFNALMLLYHLFGDFGLSIIVLTIAISLLLLPLTIRQLKSAKVVLALRTELEEIRRQHPQDLRARREATQALYKQRGVAPTSPYLPLLIQAPIFAGLFFALNIVLNHASLTQLNSIIYPFLPQLTSVPIIDLTWFAILNPTWHISLGLPDPTHVLPLLAGLMTFVQMRMAQPQTAVEIKDAMIQITQVVQFVLPLIMVLVTIFIAWQLAAGLALYRITSLLINMILQYFVSGWGSLLTVPRVAGVSDNGGFNSNLDVERMLPLLPSPKAKGPAGRKGASNRRRRRKSSNNKNKNR